MKSRACELCGAQAAVYCPSDAAFLCWNCDSEVHEANFLVARHIRQEICSNCNNCTGSEISGVGFKKFPVICSSCPPISSADSISSSSNSSVCISSTTSPAGGRKDAATTSSVNEVTSGTSESRVDIFEAEGIFVNWCKKLGLESNNVAVHVACSALKVCLVRWKILPPRVCLAASMWLGLRLGKERSVLTRQVLMRLEQISGVPAKVIVATELKVARALRCGRVQQRRRIQTVEGWAES